VLNLAVYVLNYYVRSRLLQEIDSVEVIKAMVTYFEAHLSLRRPDLTCHLVISICRISWKRKVIRVERCYQVMNQASVIGAYLLQISSELRAFPSLI
jgi:hypothetical protein